MSGKRFPLIKIIDNPERVYPIALLALCAVVFFYGLGRLPFIGPDEPRYAEVAREMYLSGDWITPRLGGVKWFEKPALTYWLSAAGYGVFGENEFGARFGVAVVATLGVLLLYFFGRRERSARFGYLSAAALATCGLWPGLARGATFDLPLSVAIEIALFSFFLWHNKESQTGANRLWYAFCFALGLATLAKGLVGVIVPLAVIALYLILTREWKTVLQPRLLVFGALVFLLTTAVWYAPVIATNGRGFIDEFFIGHHFQRYLSNKYRHPQPFYFFSLVALAGSFPWSFCLVSFLLKADAWASLKGWLQSPSSKPSSRKTPGDRLQLFLGCWIIAPIVFFSFSGSKLPGYILPIFPAVALVVGRELDRWWSDESRPPVAISFLTSALIAAAGIGAGVVLQRELGVSAREAWLMGSVAVLAAIAHVGLLFFKQGRAATLYLPIGLAAIVVAASHLVFPGLGNRESLKKLSLMAVQESRPSERLVFFVNQDHGINFYATGLPLRDTRSELVTVMSDDEIALLIEASRSQSLLIISPRRWSDGLMKSEKLQFEKIGEQEFNSRCSPECDWALLRARKNVAVAQP